ncbi:uncharacterized protein LOC126322687 [Schistocerca gregaria]|uniref:uncharacterized protein LOC126322687 n=1 Tax=Schistocerca gregaria TaxID=7010 RepID=UPI00211E9E1F|nr:uncharacterized protein LOC126322687 [Schistocerca gregaria]
MNDYELVVQTLTDTQFPERAPKALELLKNYECKDGYLRILLHILENREVPIEVRTVAAIHLKTTVRTRWKAGNDQGEEPAIGDGEKAFIRDNILLSIKSNASAVSIRNQLEEVLRSVVSYEECPDNLHSLTEQIFGALGSGEKDSILAALICLRGFRFSKNDPVQSNFVASVLDKLRSLLKCLVDNNDADSLQLQLLIVKNLRKISISTDVPLATGCRENLEEWMNLLVHSVFGSPAPTVSPTPALWIKLRVNITYLFIMYTGRYSRITRGKLHSGISQETIEVANYWMSTYAVSFLNKCFYILTLYSKNQLDNKKFLSVVLDYIHNSIAIPSLWDIIKPHLWDLFTNVFIPILCLNSEDQYLSQNNPVECVIIEEDSLYNIDNPRSQVLQCIYRISSQKSSLDYLQTILGLIVDDIFVPYSKSLPEHRDICKKYAGLTVLGNLSRLLRKSEKHLNSIEYLLVCYVYPDFESPSVDLRAKACWAFSRLCGAHFSDQQNLVNGLNSIINLFVSSNHILVTCHSGKALIELIRLNAFLPLIKSFVPAILNKCIEVMSTIESESIVSIVKYLIKVFPTSVQKQAVELMKHLLAKFFQSANAFNSIPAQQEGSADSEYDDLMSSSALFTATETLRTIRILYTEMHRQHYIQSSIEPYMFSAIESCFQENFVPFISDGIDLFTKILRRSTPPFSQKIWSFVFYMKQAFVNWAPDHISEMIEPLIILIICDQPTFLDPGSPYLEQIYLMANHALSDPNFSESDALYVVQLLEVVLIECKGSIDHVLPAIIELTINRIRKPCSTPFKVLLLEIILSSFWYNAELTLHLLNQLNHARDILELTFGLLQANAFSRLHDKKCAILGLCSLLRLPYAQLGPYCQEKLQDMISVLLRVARDAHVQRSQQDAQKTEEEEEEEELTDTTYDSDSENSYSDDSEYGDYYEEEELEEDADKIIEALQSTAPNCCLMKQDDANGDATPVNHSLKQDDDGLICSTEDDGWQLDDYEEPDELSTKNVIESIYFLETIEGSEIRDHIMSSFSEEERQIYQFIASTPVGKPASLGHAPRSNF